MTTAKSPKFFVLDTNALLHNTESISSFEDNLVALPITVIEEPDNFKRHKNERNLPWWPIFYNLHMFFVHSLAGAIIISTRSDTGASRTLNSVHNCYAPVCY